MFCKEWYFAKNRSNITILTYLDSVGFGPGFGTARVWGLVSRIPCQNPPPDLAKLVVEVPRFHPRTGRGPLVVRSLACCIWYDELRIHKAKWLKCRKLPGTEQRWPSHWRLLVWSWRCLSQLQGNISLSHCQKVSKAVRKRHLHRQETAEGQLTHRFKEQF